MAATVTSEMSIEYDMLITYGGFVRRVEKGDIIFREGDIPYFYFQVLEGEIKQFSTNAVDKDLILGIFKPGESFGEPPLLLGKPYPCTAQANSAAVIIKITKERFLNILKDYPELYRKFMFLFAKRIYKKSAAVQIWVNQPPEDKIRIFFANLKEESGCVSSFLVPYTRQQIADFTGLRVETVIRTLIKMSKQNKIKITDHKVYV